MPEYHLSKGIYGARHVERAKAEIRELAEKALRKPVKQIPGFSPEKSAGFYVTFQYLKSVDDPAPCAVRVFVWGNSRSNALHLALGQPVVREFIEMAVKAGHLVDSFVNPSGLVSVEQAEGLISKQGW